ncbi:MAG: NACHT domain-containing protein [Mesorhizobium sp.]|uniref:AVAST type 3 anti-phage nuclease/ATPase Avs3a n=1 Tax=Mesorhizobium sp. TaxID=1871066 RepID=UPI000FEA7059|nr:AVAST type 3 anti-phage nuclease/ATPase Avs3a [Mesorhizobium sp.]RWL80907.1 MAG: NACHT domain-containing protein [Mesorhizobium sp.]RWL87118.1 MAG: NACHT domain-containing protein [Mesorhizobium sp.]RWL99375.1 MAG: NACHT domain-containing protein [Mesorhizobium sp.]
MRKPTKEKAQATTSLVRPSRDGDQFHYLWAARRCLNLLLPGSDLKSVTIEGASPSDKTADGPIRAGEEVIDVAEYFGDSDFKRATLVRYIQLKHSTEAPNTPWPASGLENTISGFAKRYKAILAASAKSGKHPVLEFLFVSNRPISPAVIEAVRNAAKGLPVKPVDLKKLEGFTGLTGAELQAFCKLLKLEGKHDALWDQRNILFQDVSQYLPDADVDAPTQLKELVTRKALSEAESNPSIQRMDVLRALKADEERLYPAPCLIEQLNDAVPREQEGELIKAIVEAGNRPVIVHAEGGIGKSIFATRIGSGLPAGSVSILYDCFGNGQYRSATRYRHRHKDALVQIVNELAGKSLCHLLIPTSNAGATDYLKAFIFRLKQAVGLLRAENPQALLCIIVDAADNAQMAAEEIGEARSFIRDLLREKIPDGVRIVALCRSHRQEKLDPPPTALPLELKSFSRAETAAHLRHTFPDASEPDIDEFHRLSSHNPRVQALALAGGGPLAEILRQLGPNPTTVEKAIGNLLSAAIAKMRDEAGTVEKTQIDRICAGLAALRPLVPISVLSSMSGVSASAIKSFAYDLRRPLLVTGETIQFFDEPSETWFRERFKPTAADLSSFVASIRPLASGSTYVAAVLPQLMLEAGQFDELVALALSSGALPELNPLDRRDVELQRLQFALKASLRAKRYVDAAKLALKTGGETAGDERQRKLLQENTDLASALMEGGRIQELVSRRIFGSGWVGSHNAFEAALMSGHPELLGDARSRLRMANQWLTNWARLPAEERAKEKMTDSDIGEIAIASFNIHGARACVNSLKGWSPPDVAFRVGRYLAQRFVDHSRFKDLDDLALVAGDHIYLVLAIVVELREVYRTPPKSALTMCLKQLRKPTFTFEEAGESWNRNDAPLNAVTALIEACHQQSIGTATVLARLLTRYLPKDPPRGLSSRFNSARTPILRAYTLRAALRGTTLGLLDLAHPELRAELEKKNNYSQSQETQEFREDVGALLPWHTLWATRFVRKAPKAGLAAAIARTIKESATAARINYREEWRTSDQIVEIWLAILVQARTADSAALLKLNDWIAELKRPLFTPTLARLARRTARIAGLSAYALQYADKAYQLTKDEREHADTKSEMYVSLARSVLAASPAEAKAYFNQAVEVASRIGDENIDRWAAMLDLAEVAADQNQPVPKTAYELSRCAEVTYDYVARDKHFDWERTVQAIAGLCPASSLAILSRWRDRAFGWPEKVLPMAVDFLIERKVLDARKAVPLIGFRAHWDLPHVTKSALEACATQAERQSVADFCYRHMEMSGHSIETWRELKEILAKHRIAIAELQARLALREKHEGKKDTDRKEEEPRKPKRWKEDAKKDWRIIFRGVDPTAANGLSLAQRRFREGDAPFYQDQFFQQAIARVPAGKEAEFIAALAEVPEFDLYHLRNFLEAVPAEWKTRLAIKTALASSLRIFARRYCLEITRSRYYEMLPLKKACELAGVDESDIIDVVLSGIGEVTEIVGVGRLFTLVGLLAGRLTRNEALEALGYGLQLFNAVLKDTDGDGPWSPALAPPADIDSAIAGYVFGALASPWAAVRWEAAHAAHAICLFEQRAILSALVKFADGGAGSAFADARLFFYQLHARQWLLIALARAAKDRPEIVAAHADVILTHVQPAEGHAFIREMAKRAALTLIDAGLLAPEMRAEIQDVNVSRFPVTEARTYDRKFASPPPNTAAEEEDRFYFGMDIGPYWFAPLGKCFGLQEEDIERRVVAVIRDDWGYLGRLNWEEDERTRRKILEYDDTQHRHGSYPRADELRVYLSYHAMMVVAGQLLDTTPTYRSPDYDEEDFSTWLHSGHGLSRRDGYWLADRRDPIPPETRAWNHDDKTGDWRSSVRRTDFDRVFFPPSGMVVLWGYWTACSGRQQETCNVRSALVSADRSSALLRALQTADDHHDYLIPDAADDRQIDFGPFQLKGWLVDRSCERGIDEKDAHAGRISYPAPFPSKEVIEAMNLKADREQRYWRQKESAPVAMIAETWGTFQEKDDDTPEERGDRVQASLPFIEELLRRLGMDMIVNVEIERRRSYSRYESHDEDDKKRIPPSTQLFLIKSDGRIRTV